MCDGKGDRPRAKVVPGFVVAAEAAKDGDARDGTARGGAASEGKPARCPRPGV